MMLDDNITTGSGSCDTEHEQTFVYTKGEEAALVSIVGHPKTDVKIFTGVCLGDGFVRRMTVESSQVIIDTLVQAINNRTKERNYFRLLSKLYSGETTEDEFESTINDNEGEFVVKMDKKPSMEELQVAFSASKDIMDVETTDDLCSLFSFSPYEFQKVIPTAKQ